MAEKKQDVLLEVERWERETGYSAEATYNTHPSATFTDMTEEKRAEGVALWQRYLDAWEAEESGD